MSRLIVLLTDFGTKDAYVASMKGVIARIAPSAKVIDLSHEIEPQNIREAAFVLEAAYPYFPKGSIFVSVVDPGVGSERMIVAVRTSGGIFLAPDNGLLTRILEGETKREIRHATNRQFFLKQVSSTFHGRDCFAPTAARLAGNPSLFYQVGPSVTSFKRIDFPRPETSGKKTGGEIVYFDHFGNAFTNVTRSDLQKGSGSKKGSDPFCVWVKGKKVGSIRRSYFEAPRGKAVPVFSSTGILEIAVNQGSARKTLKLAEGDPVDVYSEGI